MTIEHTDLKAAVAFKVAEIERKQVELAELTQKLKISLCIAEIWPEAFTRGTVKSPKAIQHTQYRMPSLTLWLKAADGELREFNVWKLPRGYRDHCLERFLRENDGDKVALKYRVNSHRHRLDRERTEEVALKLLALEQSGVLAAAEERVAMSEAEVRPCYIVCNTDGSTQQKRFKIHEDLAMAAAQAKGLAKAHPGDDFMVMTPLGGYRYVLDGEAMIELTIPKLEESEAIAPSTAV